MQLKIKILLLASLLALGTCPVRAQEISSNGKLSPGASGSSTGLISGGGKVYSNLELPTGGISRSRDVSPEVRDGSTDASQDTSEEDARKRRLRLKAKREREREKERKLKQQAAAREMRMAPSGFTTFIAPPYPYRERY